MLQAAERRLKRLTKPLLHPRRWFWLAVGTDRKASDCQRACAVIVGGLMAFEAERYGQGDQPVTLLSQLYSGGSTL